MFWVTATNSQSNWPVAKNATAILVCESASELRCLNNNVLWAVAFAQFGAIMEGGWRDVITTERRVFAVVHLTWVGPVQHLWPRSQL